MILSSDKIKSLEKIYTLANKIADHSFDGLHTESRLEYVDSLINIKDTLYEIEFIIDSLVKLAKERR